MPQYSDVPQIVRDFLMYIQIARGESKVTCEDYYFDLRTFFKYMKIIYSGINATRTSVILLAVVIGVPPPSSIRLNLHLHSHPHKPG